MLSAVVLVNVKYRANTPTIRRISPKNFSATVIPNPPSSLMVVTTLYWIVLYNWGGLGYFKLLVILFLQVLLADTRLQCRLGRSG